MQLQFPRGVATPEDLLEDDPIDRIIAYVLESSYVRLHFAHVLDTLIISVCTQFSLSMAERSDSK